MNFVLLSRLEGTRFQVIAQSEDQVEVSFTRMWNGSATQLPLNVDRRYYLTMFDYIVCMFCSLDSICNVLLLLNL